MKPEVVAFIAVACGLFLYSITRKKKVCGKDHAGDDKEECKDADDVKFYKKQKVSFVKDGESYVKTMEEELKQDNPHFNHLRTLASTDAKGVDFFGVKMEDQTWLFPVSQKHLKFLYSMTNLGGKMESIPFNHAVGYAPKGMPFMETNEHWKELRKNLAAIFHSNFMDEYLTHFNTAVKDLAIKWKGESGKTLNVKTDICNMAYDSAVYVLTGSKLDVNVPYHGDKDEELHIRDVNSKNIKCFYKACSNKRIH